MVWTYGLVAYNLHNPNTFVHKSGPRVCPIFHVCLLDLYFVCSCSTLSVAVTFSCSTTSVLMRTVNCSPQAWQQRWGCDQFKLSSLTVKSVQEYLNTCSTVGKPLYDSEGDCFVNSQVVPGFDSSWPPHFPPGFLPLLQKPILRLPDLYSPGCLCRGQVWTLPPTSGRLINLCSGKQAAPWPPLAYRLHLKVGIPFQVLDLALGNNQSQIIYTLSGSVLCTRYCLVSCAPGIGLCSRYRTVIQVQVYATGKGLCSR